MSYQLRIESEEQGLVALYDERKYLLKDMCIYDGCNENALSKPAAQPGRRLMLYCFALPEVEMRPGTINFIFLYVAPPRFVFAHGLSTEARVEGRTISAWVGEDISLDQRVSDLFSKMRLENERVL
jgi:hypothetical protein